MLEHESHAHHHRTGRPWVDLTLAVSAMLVSVISLVVSIGHGRTMERLVEENARQVKASTLPILRFGTGDIDVAGISAVHFDVSNGGTGPAIIDWFALSWDGRPVSNTRELIAACCQAAGGEGVAYVVRNLVTGQTLAPAQSLTAFYLRKEGSDPQLYRELDTTARFRFKASACFCSVLDQCWTTDFVQTRPTPVASCSANRPAKVW